MVYAMRAMVVAGILLASVGCKKAETPVQPQPATMAPAPTPAVPASAPVPTAPVPTKVAPPRVKAPARVPKGAVSRGVGGAIGPIFWHHKPSGMPIC
jgi:hypothetical protein